MQLKSEAATDRNWTETTSVKVGYLGLTEGDLPSLPAGYEFQVLDRTATPFLDNLKVCLVFAGPDDAGVALRKAREQVGGHCVLVAVIREGLGRAWLPRLIDLGADDVLTDFGEDHIALALKKAEKTSEERRNAQEAMVVLEKERDLIQGAIDNLPSPIFFKNREGYYCGCNVAFSRYIGMTKDEIRGASVYDVAPDHLAAVYEEADEKLMSEGGSQLYEAAVRYADGDLRHVSFHKGATRDPHSGAVTGLAGAMLDITERKKLEEKLRQAADLDHLTGAYNRRKFFQVVSDIEEAKEADQDLSVLVIDVDNFKRINDIYGHAVGDGALCHLVDLLESRLDGDHIFARAGGEEFFVLLRNCDLDEASAISEKLRQDVESSEFELDGAFLTYRVSVGVAVLEDGETVAAALKRADKALYEAKRIGRNRVFVA